MTGWLEAVETPEALEENLIEKESLADMVSPASGRGKQPTIGKGNESGNAAFLRWKLLHERMWSEQDESINNMDQKIVARKRALVEDGGVRYPDPDQIVAPEPAEKKSKQSRQ